MAVRLLSKIPLILILTRDFIQSACKLQTVMVVKELQRLAGTSGSSVGSMLILHFYNPQPVSPLFLSISGINQVDLEHYRIHGILEMGPPQLFKIHPPPITRQGRTLSNSLYRATLVAAAQQQKTLTSRVKPLILLFPPIFVLVRRSTFKIIRFLRRFHLHGPLATALHLLKLTL